MYRNKLLITGAVPFLPRPRSLGGVTVLMNDWLTFCRRNQIPYIHIASNRFGGPLAPLLNTLYVFQKYCLYLFFCDTVMFNVTRNGIFRMYPLLAPIAKLFHKKIVLRIFGGNLSTLFDQESAFGKKQVEKTMQYTDLILAETNENLAFLRKFVHDEKKLQWFPNVRIPSTFHQDGKYRKRYVFISRIIEEKGVDIILRALEKLGPEYSVDFYGPLNSKQYTPSYFTDHGARYMGCVAPENVRETLSRYDVLLLPTFFNGEGYPGIIIEAMSIGMPVIATTWRGIPEIIQNQREGILIPPRNIESLYLAMRDMDEEHFLSM